MLAPGRLARSWKSGFFFGGGGGGGGGGGVFFGGGGVFFGGGGGGGGERRAARSWGLFAGAGGRSQLQGNMPHRRLTPRHVNDQLLLVLFLLLPLHPLLLPSSRRRRRRLERRPDRRHRPSILDPQQRLPRPPLGRPQQVQRHHGASKAPQQPGEMPPRRRVRRIELLHNHVGLGSHGRRLRVRPKDRHGSAHLHHARHQGHPPGSPVRACLGHLFSLDLVGDVPGVADAALAVAGAGEVPGAARDERQRQRAAEEGQAALLPPPVDQGEEPASAGLEARGRAQAVAQRARQVAVPDKHGGPDVVRERGGGGGRLAGAAVEGPGAGWFFAAVLVVVAVALVPVALVSIFFSLFFAPLAAVVVALHRARQAVGVGEVEAARQVDPRHQLAVAALSGGGGGGG
jgi:hypothetical protein